MTMVARTDYQKLVQAKDVPELPILRYVASCKPWAIIWHIAELPVLANYPFKVVRAKLQQMVNSGLMSGCCCGCRGDFELEPAGREKLAVSDAVQAVQARREQ